jgi:hypothetical protein
MEKQDERVSLFGMNHPVGGAMSHHRILNPLLSQPHRAWFVGTLAAIVLAVGLGNEIPASGQALAIEAVSNRADLVSGDILVRVTLPPNVGGDQPVLLLNGQALANPLRPAPDGRGYLALVTGMNLGHNTFMLVAGGDSVQLDVTNYPIGGPVFSGPHLQPWICTTRNHGASCIRHALLRRNQRALPAPGRGAL